MAVRVDAVPTAWFEVEFDGIGAGGTAWAVVRSVSGLDMTVEVQTVWEGGRWDGPHQLPKHLRYAHVELHGAVVDERLFYDWFTRVRLDGGIAAARADGTIRLKRGTGNGETVATWNVIGAYPVAYSGPRIDAARGTIAIERIVLAHQRIERV